MAPNKLVLLALAFPSIACGSEGAGQDASLASLGEAVSAHTPGFSITSPAFANGDPIPVLHTCQDKPFGAGTSPELNWAKGPKPHGVRSYAVVFKDLSLTELSPPDNRGFHWVIWDIRTHKLEAGLGSEEFVANPPHARQWSRYSPYGYLGPCPNWDPNVPHRTDTYSFTLYALDEHVIELPPVNPALPNYVRVMDEYLSSIAIDKTELRGTSDAKPTTAPVPPGPPPPPSPRP
jgi:phosphatidylethanolamine-binding protein (PEBP) family uncharacterized protein